MESVARYPVSAESNVYYSPDSPRETVLEARSSWTAMRVLFGLGLGLLFLPLILWLLRKKIDRKSCDQT